MAVPTLTPVTIPMLDTVATWGLLLIQLPPNDGNNVVVDPMHICDPPVTSTIGLPFTVKTPDGLDVQPVAALVNVKVATPGAIEVIKPELLMVATAGLLLVQTPPEVGVI